MKDTHKTEVIGTRAGNAIRFTCPACLKENAIVYHMPKDFFHETRDANCTGCRKRYTVLTPGSDHRGAGRNTAPPAPEAPAPGA